MSKIHFHQVQNQSEREQATQLIREYLTWLNEWVQREYDLSFDIEAMVRSDLTDRQKFQPPRGRFYLVRWGEQAAGVGCLKELGEGAGEIQRMYVRPAFRGRGLGRSIAERLIADARTIGYQRLRLESLEFLSAAHALYRSLGFREIAPYAQNSMQGFQPGETLERYYAITVFMEMELQRTIS